jgi:hypothetical protein
MVSLKLLYLVATSEEVVSIVGTTKVGTVPFALILFRPCDAVRGGDEGGGGTRRTS